MAAECLFYPPFRKSVIKINRLTFKRRRTLLVIALLIALSWMALSGDRQHRPNNDQVISSHSIPLDPRNPSRTELGKLRFLGAWVLESENDRFGGISSLEALPDGRFVALGDGATLIDFRIAPGGAIVDPFIRPLPWRGNQKEEPEYEERDSESIVRVPETGEYWISFENRSSLRRYSPDLSRELETIRPKAMKRWPSNGGGEALARLVDGRFILIAEYGEAKGGGYEGLIWPGQPSAKVEPQRFAYLPPEGFHATDAKVLPDGRLLVLNRRLAFPTGLSAALTVIDGDAIRPGARVRGTLLAKLESPLAVDNMEALAVTQEGGQNIVWIASDDNFNAFQRILLMKFALPETPSATTGPGFDSLN